MTEAPRHATKKTFLPVYANVQDRVRASVSIDPATGCWNWQRSTGRSGYGRTQRRGEKKTVKASRLSYEAFVGPVPGGLWVLHKCDNRRCVNPEHLYAGTQGDNTKDALERQRYEAGEKRHNAKLTEAEVAEIRQLVSIGAATQVELATRFGVSYSVIGQVVHHRSWTKSLEPGAKVLVTRRPKRGEECHRSKLSSNQVAEIRARYRAGGTCLRVLAKEYGVGKSAIASVINGRTWR